MNKTFDKKKIVNILFGIAVFILAANLVIGKFAKKGSRDKSEENSGVIESQFKDALSNLGIKEDWITKQKGNDEPLKFSVKIPKDLPVVLILQEMNYVFNTANVVIKSSENKIGGKTLLDFISGGETKLEAVFNYDSKVERKSVRVGFLVNRFKQDTETDSLLLDFPENFAIVLVPSKSSVEFKKKIIESRKEYVVYLDDNIDELEYRLKSSYSVSRLKSALRTIVGAFPQAVFFIIDNKSDLYNSPAYSLIKKEMEKRKIRLLDKNSFNDLAEANGKNINNVFDDLLNKLQGGEDKILIISAEDFLSLKPEIIKYRKLGYRFSNPSALLH
jgi:hypothetical protein